MTREMDADEAMRLVYDYFKDPEMAQARIYLEGILDDIRRQATRGMSSTEFNADMIPDKVLACVVKLLELKDFIVCAAAGYPEARPYRGGVLEVLWEAETWND